MTDIFLVKFESKIRISSRISDSRFSNYAELYNCLNLMNFDDIWDSITSGISGNSQTFRKPNCACPILGRPPGLPDPNNYDELLDWFQNDRSGDQFGYQKVSLKLQNEPKKDTFDCTKDEIMYSSLPLCSVPDRSAP